MVNARSGQGSGVRGQLILLALLFLIPSWARAQVPSDKAKEVITAAIEAMGGESYVGFKNYHRQGRYFIFDRRGRQGFSRFFDWTALEPIKWRFQLGEGKRQEVQIYNLEINKAWLLEGKSSVEEVSEEEDLSTWTDSSIAKDYKTNIKLAEKKLKKVEIKTKPNNELKKSENIKIFKEDIVIKEKVEARGGNWRAPES